jgi:penicillin-binding protein 2
MGVIVVLGFLVLTVRLFQLQIVEGKKYKRLSENNRVSEVPIPAPRGVIYDRNGEPLAKNNFRSSVFYIVSGDPGIDAAIIEKLRSTLALTADKAREIKESVGNAEPEDVILVKEDVPKSKVIRIEEQTSLFPRTIIETIPRRSYPYGRYAAHVIGYIGLISSHEYEQLKHLGYSSSDIVGKNGIEKMYDSILRGEPGVKKLLVDVTGKVRKVKQRPALDAQGEEILDNQGRPVFEDDIRKPVAGRDIELTLDIELQSAIAPLLGERRGAVVVMDPSDGAILAMVSSPAFDPNLFVGRVAAGDWQELATHEGHPLQNRAIQNAFPPGSTFKLCTAWAALDAGKITENTSVYCNGTFELGPRVFRCWERWGHGRVDFVDAVAYSCDVFFYNAGYETGNKLLARKAELLGLGSATGVDLPGEINGRVPDGDWKQTYIGERWFGGDTVNMSIGQGYLQSTPLQLVRMAAVFANGGKLVTPHLLKIFTEDRPRAVGIDPSHLNLIRRGMRAAVTKREGTAHELAKVRFSIAAKTGTAEDPPRENPHSWLVAFAPYDDPKVVAVFFLENVPETDPKAVDLAADVFTLPWMREYILGD